MDFTLTTYRQLLQSLQDAGFSFITFSDYIESYRDSGSPASETMRDEKLQDFPASGGTGNVRVTLQKKINFFGEGKGLAVRCLFLPSASTSSLS